MKQNYWNRSGLYQEQYNKFYNELIPSSGKCNTREGEMLLASSWLYNRYFKDGDMIVEVMPEYMKGCSALNAFGFLYHQAETKERMKELLKCYDEDEYQSKLEEIANIVIKFIIDKNGNYSSNSEDMFDDCFVDNLPVDFNEEAELEEMANLFVNIVLDNDEYCEY